MTEHTRDAVAAALLAALPAAVPGSSAELRGSLAAGTADEFSDIDLLWIVPDRDLLAALVAAEPAAATVAPVLWVRAHPDLARSARRRKLAVRFDGLPLFWRVDLDVRTAGIADDEGFDLDNPAARAQLTDPAAMALEDAVAALKALGRGDPDAAAGMLTRGYERLGSRFDGVAEVASAVRLAEACAILDPRLRPLAEAVRRHGAAIGER